MQCRSGLDCTFHLGKNPDRWPVPRPSGRCRNHRRTRSRCNQRISKHRKLKVLKWKGRVGTEAERELGSLVQVISEGALTGAIISNADFLCATQPLPGISTAAGRALRSDSAMCAAWKCLCASLTVGSVHSWDHVGGASRVAHVIKEVFPICTRLTDAVTGAGSAVSRTGHAQLPSSVFPVAISARPGKNTVRTSEQSVIPLSAGNTIGNI